MKWKGYLTTGVIAQFLIVVGLQCLNIWYYITWGLPKRMFIYQECMGITTNCATMMFLYISLQFHDKYSLSCHMGFLLYTPYYMSRYVYINFRDDYKEMNKNILIKLKLCLIILATLLSMACFIFSYLSYLIVKQ